MDFEIKNLQKSVVEVAREIGYMIIDSNENAEYNLVRKLTGQNYPRFHVYLKSRPSRGSSMASPSGQRGQDFIFSLHLDQKKPSYAGSHAHSGEYTGPVVDEEAERIQSILNL